MPGKTPGSPSDERRVSHRRAPEPEGVSVRVGAAGEPAEKGRRAEDRVEALPPVSEATTEEIVELAGEEVVESAGKGVVESAGEEFVEPAVEDSVEPEPIESKETSDLSTPDREFPTAPALPRHAPFSSRRAVALSSLLVAFVAVAIPVIRSLLSEPRPVAVTELQADPRGSVQGDLREPTPGNFQESKPAGLVDPSEAIEPANALPPAETFRPLAVQINASPWANIEVDGIDLGATPLANIPLFAGEHSFRARMPDGRVIERRVEIDAERRFISFE
ncbi:MAG: hypothetical protein IH885_07465 [Myxococcales bacterium]|nr:hypothetical protein [Myxococcales bacterium]